MDVLQVLELVDELRGMDVQVLPPAFLADDSLGAFGVAAHVLADLLVDLALRVYQTALAHCYICRREAGKGEAREQGLD